MREDMIYIYDNLSDIAASNSIAEQRLYEGTNTDDDILFIEEADIPRVLHGAVGITPYFIKQFIRYPEGENIAGKWPKLTAVQPTTNEKYGFQSGRESPFDSPSDFKELWIPPQIHLGFAHYNPDSGDSHEPLLNVVFEMLDLEIIKPTNEPSPENQMIIDIVTHRTSDDHTHVATCGNPRSPVAFNDKYKNGWGVEPIKWSTARNLKGVAQMPQSAAEKPQGVAASG